jgi:hypothetical protein
MKKLKEEKQEEKFWAFSIENKYINNFIYQFKISIFPFGL